MDADRGDVPSRQPIGPIRPSRRTRQAGAHSTTGEWMRLGFRPIPAILFTGIALLALPSHLCSQEPGSGLIVAGAAELPEAPLQQLAPAAAEPRDPQTPAQPAPGSTPAPKPGAQGSSSSPTTPQQPGAEKSQHDRAEEQIKEQEKQRVVGVVPSFNVSYRSDAVSMTAGQKIRLAFRSSIDPVAFAAPFLVAGYHEARDDDPGFPWGIKGLGERSGVAYLDAFNGTMIGNGILPAILHQDPRYFRLGHGTATHRLLYALSTNVICRHDNTGKWQPNYSNVLGNIAAGGLSNLYYPSASRSGVGLTFSNGFVVTAEGGAGSIFQEFWPDISRRVLHRDPTHGLDARARAQDAAEKQAREEAKQNQK